VDLEELNLWWIEYADFFINRAELLPLESLERLSGFPHVDDAKTVVGLHDPMKEFLSRGWSAWEKSDPFVDLIVLSERGTPEIKLHCDGHRYLHGVALSQMLLLQP